MDLALNNLQRLICHKTKPNQPTNSFFELIDVIYFMIKLFKSEKEFKMSSFNIVA